MRRLSENAAVSSSEGRSVPIVAPVSVSSIDSERIRAWPCSSSSVKTRVPAYLPNRASTGSEPMNAGVSTS